MKVFELIQALQTMPPDANVRHLWDGSAYTAIEHVWLARDGTVITADFGEVCYSTETRPESAPTQEKDRYWHSPKNPNPELDEYGL